MIQRSPTKYRAREDGSLIHPEAFLHRFAQLANKAGLPPIRLHDVRHSYATAALSAGVPVKVVSTRMGHASTSFTQDIYAHVLDAQDDQAAEAMAALIGSR